MIIFQEEDERVGNGGRGEKYKRYIDAFDSYREKNSVLVAQTDSKNSKTVSEDFQETLKGMNNGLHKDSCTENT